MSERKTRTIRINNLCYEDIWIPIKKNEAKRKGITFGDIKDADASLILRQKILKLGGIKED